MFTKRTHDSDPKAAILRGIYHDNLKMAGKPVHSPRALQPARRFGRLLPMLLVMVVVALGPFSDLDPSLRADRDSTQFKGPDTSGRSMTALRVDSETKADPAAAAPSQNDTILDSIPMWDFVGPGKQEVQDFDLLLAERDKVRLSSLFGLGVKTVVIDPGHGGRDPGAIGAGGTREKDITLDVAVRLKTRLTGESRLKVLLTRDSDKTLSLADRVAFAKENNADLFISLHVNSLPDDTINIIETYYFGAPLNSDSLWLAEQENKESHFSVGELDAIIADLNNTLKRQESAKLATAIQASLFSNLSRQDTQVLDIGIKMAPFVVLSQIEVPSVLVEISCITNEEEEAKLASAGYRAKVASYIQEGVVAYLDTQHFVTLRGDK